MTMNDYWFLCRDTGIIKYFGSFPDFDEADAYLRAHGLDPVWIFSGKPEVEEAQRIEGSIGDEEKRIDTPHAIVMLLLPCPFCGCDGESLTITHCEEDCCGAKPRSIQCECGCELSGTWNTDDDAVRSWNTRQGKGSEKNFFSKLFKFTR
jgi:hypothetical protein